MITSDREQAEADPETKKSEPLLPEPLTRRGYKRRPDVERRITEASSLDRVGLQAHALQRDENAPDYFPPEALAYFIRRAARSGDKRLVNFLIRELNLRCQPILNKYVRGRDEETRTELLQRILIQIANILLASSDLADFAQVSFWRLLKVRVIDVCRAYTSEIKGLDESLDYDPTDPTGEKNREGLYAYIANKALSPEQELLVKKGLAKLPPKLQEAFIMAHQFEMKIESKDPNELTVSRHFGVSEKTVRTWLKEAERLLASFRGELL